MGMESKTFYAIHEIFGKFRAGPFPTLDAAKSHVAYSHGKQKLNGKPVTYKHCVIVTYTLDEEGYVWPLS